VPEIVRDDDRARQEYGPREFPPIHPGQILSLEFMEPHGLSQSQLARDLKLPFRRVHEIVNGKRSVSAETAFILARYFSTQPQYWLDLQAHYDLARARDAIQGHLAKIRPMASA
jgi:addiction module HigA family antidote